MPFLPTTVAELNGTQPDFILVSVDAYVDHPSFGHAIVSRLVEAQGFSVAIVPQPQTDAEYTALGAPRYAFLLSGGVVDSMVNNYTVAKQKRDSDAYSEGGKVGKIPDRAVTVHTKNLKRLFPTTPVVIGGIEASLRRYAHYDYWSNKVLPSILADCPADLLIYGQGENPIIELCSRIKRGIPIDKIKDIRGTAYLCRKDALPKSVTESWDNGTAVVLASYETVKHDKTEYAKAFREEERHSDFATDVPLLQLQGGRVLVVNPPAKPLTVAQLDSVYALPYMRDYHPRYTQGIPALTEVKFSLAANRGCFGDCSYCAITMHQGRDVVARSTDSLVTEAKLLTQMADFKGYIHDVGGPTANFLVPSCKKHAERGSCTDKHCIGYKPCKNLVVDHTQFLQNLRALRNLPKVKKVFIRSGIRYDYLMLDPKRAEILKELIKNHISGRLKVAPEHVSSKVLKSMNKPDFCVYENFSKLYTELTERLGKKEYLIPYLISSHPACDLAAAVNLAEYLHRAGLKPEQVQDFYPTPSTRSTTAYYTGLDPETMTAVYVPTSPAEKQTQRALMQYYLPKNRETVLKALRMTKREYLANTILKKPSK